MDRPLFQVISCDVLCRRCCLEAQPLASNFTAMAHCGCFAASQITTVGSSLSLCSTLSEDNLRRWAAGSVRTRSQRAAAVRDDGVPISSRLQGRNAADELLTQSRRSVVQMGATLAILAVFDRLPALAEPAQSEPEASVSQEAASGAGAATVQPASKPKKSLVDTESWYRVRGEGFAMSVPPNYEDIVEYDESGNSLYGERAKEKPFAARFASPDRKEVLSVVVRNGSQLKLSFLQTQDITEFGSLEEAAKVFVPAGSKIVAAATHKPTDSRVPRTYYLYEFLAKDDKRVVMSAAAAGGRVFVFGAMAPNSRWKEVARTMRSAAINFALR